MRRLLVGLILALVGSVMIIGPADAKEPKDPKKAKREITAAYECLLSGSLNYTIDQKLACVDRVDDDPALLALATEIQQAQAAAAAIAETDIKKIKFKNDKVATVDYELVVGDMELEGIAPRGFAVLVKDGSKKVWKVSALTFCQLTQLARADVAAAGPCAPILAADKP